MGNMVGYRCLKQASSFFTSCVFGFAVMSLAVLSAASAEGKKQSVWETSSAAISITGTSTLHDWEMKGDALVGTATFTSVPKSLADLKKIPASNPMTLAVTVPVNSLKSGDDDMDEKAYEALLAEKNPEISFSLLSIGVDAEKSKDSTLTYNAEGSLTIAGTTRKVPLSVIVEQMEGGYLKATTKTGIAMTDFKMEPPRAMMGLIKSGNDVVVSVQWTIAPRM